MKRSANQWLILAVLWLAMMIYGLIFRETGSHTAPPFAHFDKFVHMLLFLGQIWLAAQYWISRQRTPPYRSLFVLGFILAVGTEAAQHFFTATRQADGWDVLADMLGVAMGLQIAHWHSQAKQAEKSSRLK